MVSVIYLAGMMFLQLLKADQDVRKTQVLLHILLQHHHVPLKDQFVLTCISPMTLLSSGKVFMLQVNIDPHAENWTDTDSHTGHQMGTSWTNGRA